MAIKSKKKIPVWRKSDQTNSELPIGRTWIDDYGKFTELVVVYTNVDGYRDKVWLAHPFNITAHSIYSDGGPGDVVKAWDRKISYERQTARLDPAKWTETE